MKANSVMRIDGHKWKSLYYAHRKSLLFLLFALTVSAVVACLYMGDLSSKVLKHTSYISNRDEEQFVHDFTSGMRIEQTFSCYHDFDLITLDFSDHDMVLQGKVTVQILDEQSSEILISSEKEMSDIHYQIPLEVSFADVGGGQAGRSYRVVLYSDGTADDAVGVYGYVSDDETAWINGIESEFALSIGVHGYTGSFTILAVMILGIGMLAILLVILGTFEGRFREENVFLLLACPFVICMLLMWPGNSVYDETRHYHTVYNYSNSILGYGNSEDGTELQMRKCDVLADEIQRGLGSAENAQAQSWGYYIQRMTEETGSTEMVPVLISAAPVVQNGTIIEYLPATLGLTLGRLLGVDYLGTGTLARLANVICYLALCYFAIRKTPILKSLFVLLSALPMNLYQVSGISYDGLTFGIGIVVLAYIMKLWVGRLVKKEWISLTTFAMMLGCCKGGVYLALLLLLCFIPKEHYEGRKWLKITGVVFAGGIAMLYSFVPVMMRWFGLGDNVSYVVNEIYTTSGKMHLMFAFKYPFRFIKMLAKTLIINDELYLGQMLGYRTAWANGTISSVVMLLFLVMLIFASMRIDDKDLKIDLKARLGILFILIVEVVGMHAIFLVDTPINSTIIVGCQGRYFILFIPCILLLFRNNGLIFKEKREYLYPLFSMAQLIYLYNFLELFMCA